MKRIAIFASGTGSNAKKIIDFFENSTEIVVDKIYSNNIDAGVLILASNNGIPSVVFSKKELNDEESFISKEIAENNFDLIILAGFLLLIPKWLVERYDNKIVNIHPSLLPKHGGKGMYGENVHKAVFSAGDKESGITIHYVNTEFDKGEFIYQHKVDVSNCNNPKEIAEQVLKIEHEYFPKIIYNILK